MERLTMRNSDGSVSQPTGTTVEAVFYRLAAYEDTGLEPEEITPLIPPPNDPLTLEELREMNGEPVWVECLGSKDYSVWAIVDLCLNGIHTKYFYADFDYYGDEWLAYRRKPE